MRHALNSAVTELEIRRNRRIPNGYNANIPSLTLHHLKVTIRRKRTLVEVAVLRVLDITFNGLLVSAELKSCGLIRQLPESRSKLEAPRSPPSALSTTPVLVMMSSRWSLWKSLSTILRIQRSSQTVYHIPPSTQDNRELVEFLRGSSHQPILLVIDHVTIPLINELAIQSPIKPSIIVIDPTIHPLLMAALDSGCIPTTKTGNTRGDLSRLLASGCSVRVILTSSTTVEQQRAIKLYCDLKSVHCQSLSSAESLSSAVISACADIAMMQAPSTSTISAHLKLNVESELEMKLVTNLEKSEGESMTKIIEIPTSSYAMMSSLENISSIGMCLAPPLRTRQRSKSMGTVVGYGHIAVVRPSSGVVVKMVQ